MSTTANLFPENDKIDAILARIEEMKKLIKLFRGFLNDYSAGYDNFGKSLTKSSKALLSSAAGLSNDPNIVRQLTLRFSGFEDTFGKTYGQQYYEFNNVINHIADDTMERIEVSRRKILENATIAIKNLNNARINHTKNRQKYEKACKDAELALSEKKKTPNDALKIYSLRNARKLDNQARTTLNAFLTAETQFKEAVDAVNGKQAAFNTVVQESFVTFKETLVLLTEKLFLMMQKGVETYNKVIKAYEEEAELRTGIDEGDLAQPTSDQEEDFIEEKRAAADPAGPKGIYRKLIKIAQENPSNLQEYHLQIFSEAATKHIDTTLLIMDERGKLLKFVKGFMGEIAAYYDQLSKLLQKATKTYQLQGFSSSALKTLSDCASKFYSATEMLAKKYSIFPNFVNMKGNTIDAIAKELAAGSKSYQAACQKALKDHIQVRTNYLNGLLTFERASKKLNDAEKEKNEAKIAQAKQEFEEIQTSLNELKTALKNTMLESIVGIRKAYRDYRDMELTRIKGGTGAIQGIIHHQRTAVNEIQEASKTVETGIKFEANSLDEEIDRLLEQDDKLGGFVKKNSPVLGSENQFMFTQLFSPPAEILQQFKLGDEKDDFEEDKDLDDSTKEMIDQNPEQMEKEGEKSQGSIPKYLEARFGLDPKDKFITDFSCALRQNILQQGRLYILNTKICYSSKLSREILVIPVSDIISVEKRVNALIFDNAISVKTINGEIVFASFFLRDRAHQVLTQLLKDPQSLIPVEAEPNTTTAPVTDTSNTNSAKKPDENDGNAQGEGSPTNKKDATVVSRGNSTQKSPKKVQGGTNDDTASVEEEKSPTKAGHRRVTSDMSGSRTLSASTKHQVSQIVEANDNSEADQHSPAREAQNENIQELLENPENATRLQQRKATASEQMTSLEQFDQEVFRGTFENQTIFHVYQALLTDEPWVEGKDSEKIAPWVALRLNCGDTEIEKEEFNPQPPEIFRNGGISTKESFNEFLNSSVVSKRCYKYSHPLKDQSTSTSEASYVEERQTAYWVGIDEMVLQIECISSKAPIVDTYKVKHCFQIKQTLEKAVTITWTVGVEFLKTTIFKGKIARSTLDQCQSIAQETLSPMISKHLELIHSKYRLSHPIDKRIQAIKLTDPQNNQPATPISGDHAHLGDTRNAVSEVSSLSNSPTIDLLAISKSAESSKDKPSSSETPVIKEFNGAAEETKADQINSQKAEANPPQQEEAKDKVYETSPLEKQSEFATRKETHYRQVIPIDKYPEHQITEVFEDCTVPDVFKAIFSDHPIKYNGKTYATPWLVLKVVTGDTDITHTQWKPPEPVMFAKGLISDSTLKELQEYVPVSKREYKYIHPLREQSVFAPKTATVEERHQIFWLSFDEVIVQTEVHLSKVPFSDCFTVKNCFQLKQIEPTKVQFTWKGWVDFVKNFMFKGKAYKGSVDEMADYRQRIFMPILRENFKVLQEKKKLLKAKTAQTAQTMRQSAPTPTTTSRTSSEKKPSTEEKKEIKVNGEKQPPKQEKPKEEVVEEEEEIEVEEEVVVTMDHLNTKNIAALRERGNKIRTLCIAADKFSTPIFKETVNAGIFETLNSIFSETSITTSTGSKHSSPWEAIRIIQSDTNIEAPNFYPPFPKYYAKGDRSEAAIQELISFANKSERTAKFTHPVREQSMFAPKSCTVIEKTTIYWISHEEVIVQIQVNTEGVPFCDTFVTRLHYHFKQIGENQCSIDNAMFVDFLKNPMFKGKILKATTDEVVETGKIKVLKLAKELLPFFAKLKPSYEPQKKKIKKTIKKKKAAAVNSQPSEIEPEKSPENIQQNPPEDAVVVEEEVQQIAEVDEPVEYIKPVEEVQAQFVAKEQAVPNSMVMEDLLNKLSSMERSHRSLMEEMKSLKFVLMVLIGINLAMMGFLMMRSK